MTRSTSSHRPKMRPRRLKMNPLIRPSLICAFIALTGCSGLTSSTSSSEGDETCATCNWVLEVQLIQTISGTCSFNDCGHGSHGSCSITSLMDVQEPSSGQIKLDPMIPGLLRGLYFEGTINSSSGVINTVHEAFPDSTLLAGRNLNNDTMGGQIYWKPNASCEAVIDFAATLND